MTRIVLVWSAACCALAAVVGGSGCAPPPPSEEAIIYYLRSARLGGKVRRAWPAGQAYLDEIMKRDAALQQKLELLRALVTPESLWAPGDPRWQDAQALEEHIKELEQTVDEVAILARLRKTVESRQHEYDAHRVRLGKLEELAAVDLDALARAELEELAATDIARLTQTEREELTEARLRELGQAAVARREGHVARWRAAGEQLAKQIREIEAEMDRLTKTVLERFFESESAKLEEALNRLGGQADKPDDMDALSREQMLEVLDQAVEEAPPELSLPTPETKAVFVGEVRQALAVDGEVLRDHMVGLEELAQLRLELYRQAADSADDFDAARVGLYVKVAERQAQLDERYTALRQALEARREAFIQFADKRLLRIEPSLKQMDKREERWEYDYFTNLRTYLRNRLDGFSKALGAEADRLAARQKELENRLQRAPAAEEDTLEQQIAFCQARIQELGAEKDALDSRLEDIYDRVKARVELITGSGG